jgi:Putative endonuclease segE, GIY-YIG domain
MWIYQGNIIDSIDKMPEGVHSFIYEIVNLSNGRRYIGKKQVFSERKVAMGKKELAQITDKRKKKYKYKVTESNWKSYTGSNEELNKDISEGAMYSREIIQFVFSKMEATYTECKHLFCNNVLEDENYYNSNILNTFFKGNIK